MNQWLLEILACPECGSGLDPEDERLICPSCHRAVPLRSQTPLFIPVPEEIKPTHTQTREPGTGGAWRRANWSFAERWSKELAPNSLVLEVGAGNGYYRPLFNNWRYLGTDLYPYPHIDFVSDFCTQTPLRKQCVDYVLLSSMLEHVYAFRDMVGNVTKATKPGGLLLIMVPHIVSLHQQPYDFLRYTHHSLRRLAQDNGYEILELAAYYEPRYLALNLVDNLGLSYTWEPGWRRQPSRRLAHILTRICRNLLLTAGRLCETDAVRQVLAPNEWTRSKYPMGYQMACRKL